MRTMILFLMLSSSIIFSQTKLTISEIRAAQGNNYEWPLTGVEYYTTVSKIQNYTWDKIRRQPSLGECGKNCSRFINNIKDFSDQKESIFYYDIISTPDETEKRFNWLTKKVIFKGDYNRLVEFYIEFWSRSINWNDVKKGDVVSTRFLGDIAVFSFDKNGNPQIIVQGTKEYYK